LSTPPRILVVTYDVIGPKMAGPGIRAWEFARVLGRHFPTTLAAPPPLPVDAPGFTLAPFSSDVSGYPVLTQLIQAHDIIVAQVLPISFLPDGILKDKYFVVDLYCPWLVENLEHYRIEEPADADWLIHDIETVSNLFTAGDYFVCAGDAQRAYWIGALSLFGRLTEETYAADADGRTLIDIVPFGLSAQPPVQTAPVLRGVVPGIGQDDFIALWGGGVWNWLDPLTLIRATARLRDSGYPIRSVFLGTRRPAASAAATMRPGMIDMARQLSADLHLTDSHVFFLEGWVPYDERANYLVEADAGISLHQRTLETRFAFRTRVLDYLWAGLVPVVNDGDTIADLVRTNDVGAVIPIGDDKALADTLADLIDHPERRQEFAARCRSLAPSYTWDAVTEPIVAFCQHPRKSPVDTRVMSVVLQQEVQHARQLAYETTQYAERLEGEIASRDRHIEQTARYVRELEERVARGSLRGRITGRVRTTSVGQLLARTMRRGIPRESAE
jgi:glycosyltransferase involved in cell wall biosynthesis